MPKAPAKDNSKQTKRALVNDELKPSKKMKKASANEQKEEILADDNESKMIKKTKEKGKKDLKM
ncbi:27622_t:CDS:2 [Gigaspora margarita]|uniref:27622_t:CDS:1 n=1 Tax=Gigaspora margarita TaxID=4874 RepID=A0ABN7VPU5_GIGMA|nr:27622_t:CDS:2 [Gigaspora margarita]